MKLPNLKMNKNKKAIIMAEVLRIILSVACIFLLIYISAKLYGIFTAKSDLEKARAELSNIEGKIKSLIEDTSSDNIVSVDYLMLSPQDWVFTGWPHLRRSGEVVNVPYCISKGWVKCLCMCDFKGVEFNKIKPENIAERCNTGKICIDISRVSKLKVNSIESVQLLWGLIEFGGSDVSPIYIKKLTEDFKGDLTISYDKTTKELIINPKQK